MSATYEVNCIQTILVSKSSFQLSNETSGVALILLHFGLSSFQLTVKSNS